MARTGKRCCTYLCSLLGGAREKHWAFLSFCGHGGPIKGACQGEVLRLKLSMQVFQIVVKQYSRASHSVHLTQHRNHANSSFLPPCPLLAQCIRKTFRWNQTDISKQFSESVQHKYSRHGFCIHFLCPCKRYPPDQHLQLITPWSHKDTTTGGYFS